MDIHEVLTAPRSPWQNAYAERFIGSIRRECLDHVIVLNESSLRRILRAYFDSYQHSRTHLSLDKDSPEPRVIQSLEAGTVIELPQVGGLHHRFERPECFRDSLADLGVLARTPVRRHFPFDAPPIAWRCCSSKAGTILGGVMRSGADFHTKMQLFGGTVSLRRELSRWNEGFHEIQNRLNYGFFADRRC